MSTEALPIPAPTGTTRLYAVVGYPVEQVMAPRLMNALFAARGVDAILVPVKAAPTDLAAIIGGLKSIANLDGILVTVPHKVAVCAHVDRLSERAALAQSANALRREADGSWSGDNFDGAGCVAGLLKAGHAIAGKMVCLVGAGGAGMSIGPAVLMAGAAHLTITDFAPARMTALADHLARRWPGQVAIAPAAQPGDIVINATPAGLHPDDPLPFDVAALAPGTLVVDIIMKPPMTPLLRAAQAHGLPIHPGLPMLTEQIALYQEFFRIS